MHEALASVTEWKGLPKNSVIEINNILVQYFSKLKCKRIHDEQNMKVLNKNDTSVTVPRGVLLGPKASEEMRKPAYIFI